MNRFLKTFSSILLATALLFIALPKNFSLEVDAADAARQIIIQSLTGEVYGRADNGGTIAAAVPTAGTYQIKTSDDKDIKVRIGSGSWQDRDKPSRYEGEQVAITGATTVTVQLYGSSAVVATFNITIGGSSQPDSPNTDNPGTDNPNPQAPDSNAPGVIFANVGGADIGRVAYNGTTNISVPSAGTYQLKTTDNKDIKVRIGSGSWQDRDKPSRYQGEQVTITGATTVTVQLYGSSAVVATFNITVSGSSQPDNPDTPTPTVTEIIFANIGGTEIGRVANNGTKNITVSSAGTYQIKTTDNKDIKVRIGSGSWQDRDKPSRFEGEQVAITGATTVTVQLYGSSAVVATFNITIGGGNTPEPEPDPVIPTPSLPVVTVTYAEVSGAIVGNTVNGTANFTIYNPGEYWILVDDNRDIRVRVDNGSWADRDYRNTANGIVGELLNITRSCTIYVAPLNSATPIATITITLVDPSNLAVDRAFQQEILTLVNELRASLGLNPLRARDEVTRAADIRAEEISRVYYPAHSRPDGRSCFTVFSDINFTQYRTAGENIAAGQISPQAVFNAWKNSPGHYTNMVNPNFQYLGVGYQYLPNDTLKHYWSQLFTG
ncbi:MAG: CAP domain-containing protein [Ruminococcus sp.]|nr:CAP domain-containing protein [Ruminococcus sp.]